MNYYYYDLPRLVENMSIFRQVERLHEQLSALDGVATRVREMEEQPGNLVGWRSGAECSQLWIYSPVFLMDLLYY